MNINQSRRDFIKVSIGAIGCIAAGTKLKPKDLCAQDSTRTSPNGGGARLAAVQGETVKAVIKAIEMLGGMGIFVRAGQTVLLKPNVSFPNPEGWGTDTSPGLVKAVAIEALKAGAARVIVADNTMRGGMECFNRSGLTEALAGIEKVKVLPIQEESLFTDVPVPNGRALKTVKIAKLVGKADVLINIPCAKAHNATDVSFGMKNLMGLVWDRGVFHTGTDLHTAIAELSSVIHPHLVILDASRALETGGPSGPGRVLKLNTVVAGTDPLAVDAYATSLANWNNRSVKPAMIKHLLAASRIGIGQIDPARIRLSKASV
jgi:uncharacterized protein (DUF362 family)